MDARWIKRRSHQRQLHSGRLVRVSEAWILYGESEHRTSKVFKRPCPQCGAHIISVRMPNGGWAHFEGTRGLSRMKHPCLHRGEGLSRKRDDLTIDLFEGTFCTAAK